MAEKDYSWHDNKVMLQNEESKLISQLLDRQ